MIVELCKYFSRFVSRKALENFFQKPQKDRRYHEFKDAILSLPDNRRVESLTDFIFGIDNEAVVKRISSVKGMYLFVDYSNITSTVNAYDVKNDALHVAITVAKPMPADADQAAQAVIQDECLKVMGQICRAMRYDELPGSRITWLTFPSTISPFFAKSLANSCGFSMEFNVEGIDAI